jgi:hypothetical protein
MATTTAERKIPTRAELDAHRREIIDRWFPEHVATYSEGSVGDVRVERLVWRKPGTNNYRVDYLSDGGVHLIVTGDLGDAIYQTGAHDLRWWAACDVDYFASKCIASEYGRGYRSWDEDAARARVGECLADERTNGNRKARGQFARLDGWSAVQSRGDWRDWLLEHGADFFGPDYFEYGDVGEVIDLRCAGHLVGLKRAIASLSVTELR